MLAGSLLLHVLILLFENVLAPSPTRHHELAVRTRSARGPFAPLFWGGAIACAARDRAAGGGCRHSVSRARGGRHCRACLALAGSSAWEYIWVEAGQSVPLSS